MKLIGRQVVTVPQKTSSTSVSFKSLVEQLGADIVILRGDFADIELPQGWDLVSGEDTGSYIESIDYIVDQNKYRRARVYTHCFDRSISNIGMVKRFRLTIKSQRSTKTVCPFLDTFNVVDTFTDEVVYESLPYSLDKEDAELYQKWRTEKLKLGKWFSDKYPGELLHEG